MFFHGNIALPIEILINSFLANDTKISADEIEIGGFTTVLNFLLFIKHGNADAVTDFQRKYSSYIGRSYTEIGDSKCEEIYNNFMDIYNSAKESK